MLERLILKVEGDVVLFRRFAHADVEVDLHSAFRNRLHLVWLTELNLVAGRHNRLWLELRTKSGMAYLREDVAELLLEKHLIDVDA